MSFITDIFKKKEAPAPPIPPPLPVMPAPPVTPPPIEPEKKKIRRGAGKSTILTSPLGLEEAETKKKTLLGA